MWFYLSSMVLLPPLGFFLVAPPALHASSRAGPCQRPVPCQPENPTYLFCFGVYLNLVSQKLIKNFMSSKVNYIVKMKVPLMYVLSPHASLRPDNHLLRPGLVRTPPMFYLSFFLVTHLPFIQDLLASCRPYQGHASLKTQQSLISLFFGLVTRNGYSKRIG